MVAMYNLEKVPLIVKEIPVIVEEAFSKTRETNS